MSRLALLAPVAGWSAPIEEAPDAVFAQKMLGDGLTIDPVGRDVVAPCDGQIISIAATCHAISLRAANGAEILIHVGIDTVGLGGRGFEVHVGPDARVKVGDRLLSLDLDLLAREAKSLVTPIVVTNGDRFEVVARHTGREVGVGDTLLEIVPLASAAKEGAGGVATEVSARIRVAHEHGLHARPAALVAHFARNAGATLEIHANGRSADARSAVALMSLGVRGGDDITAVAVGKDAAGTLEGLRRLIDGLGNSPLPADAAKPPREPASTRTMRAGHIQAVVASRGLAIGQAFRLRETEIAITESGAGLAHEHAQLDHARAQVRQHLQELAGKALPTVRDIILAHLEFLDDSQLVAAAGHQIDEGKSAGFAWRSAVRSSVDALRRVDDPRIAERVGDLLDLEHQVLAALAGRVPVERIDIPERAIVITEDLKPSQFVAMDTGKLAGICLCAGGPTSHVAILAAAAGVPVLVAAGSAVLGIADGTTLILDAEQGALRVAPERVEVERAEQDMAQRRQRLAAQRQAAQRHCHTADGQRIEVFANLGSLDECAPAVAQGAEGCGLLRTEFLFQEREQAPDEDEQLSHYQAIAVAMEGRPVIIRTLDVGGDKPIPYIRLPDEANPALGLRGIRTSLWSPDLLRTQLRALLRVTSEGPLRVLLPMITDVAEIREVRRLAAELCAELGRPQAPQFGAMIETPAAAVLADQIAREVDFLSVGTNDLTQYTLAMDRDHAGLAQRIDGLHPAVLRLIAMAADAGTRHGRMVAVCGGLASDPEAVPVLVGLGVRELSAVPSMIPQIKQQIGGLQLEACQGLAQQALAQDSAQAVRLLVRGGAQ